MLSLEGTSDDTNVAANSSKQAASSLQSTSARMQPTLPQSGGPPPIVTSDMDLPAVQSMDWLLKKERFYILAKFWEQVCKNILLLFIKLR